MKKTWRRKLCRYAKVSVAIILIAVLVITEDVLVMAGEVTQKTGETIEKYKEQIEDSKSREEQEDYLEEYDASQEPGERNPEDEDPAEEKQKTGTGERKTVKGQEEESAGDEKAGESRPAEDSLSLPELASEETDEFEKLYGEPVEVNEYGKIYKVDEENYKFIITPDPEKYRTEDGELKDVDNTLVEKKESVSEENAEGSVSPRRAKGRKEVSAYTNRAGDIDAQFPKEMDESSGLRLTGREGKTLELYPAEGSYDRPAVLENAILYNDVFDNIDVQYTLTGRQVKEDIILREPGEKHAFSYWFDASQYRAKLSDNAVVIADTKGERLFTLTAPVMHDAAGESSTDVVISLKEEDGRYAVTVEADREWLSDEGRNYPVRIDPTITISSKKLDVVTTSSEKGTYSQSAYGYVGLADSAVTGVPGSDLGRTRMFFKIDYDFKSSIPEEAVVTKATLNVYEYSSYESKATFACYRLKDKWKASTIDWDNSVGIGREIAGEDATLPAKKGWQRFDIRQSVNDWATGIAPQYGLMLMATKESTRGAAFYTPDSNSSQQPLFKPEYKPYIEIDWKYDNPVPADYPLDNTTITLRSLIDCNMNGNLQFMGVFADGLATPGSVVAVALSDAAKGYAMAVNAGTTKRYPNTKDFEGYFPATTTRYRDKQGNYQTAIPFTDPDVNALYYIEACAVKDNKVGKTVQSDKFTVYQVRQFDTMPKIASYYGIPLSQIVYDNRMQDMLLVENNTIFIRNPLKNANKPYNPKPLTDADKEKIDKQLMGRGMHCEFGFEPVNLNTGNFYFSSTDASVPDYNGDFSVDRDYNSKGAGYISAFGRGWQFAYGEYLSKKQDGTLIYTRGDGSSLYFSEKSGSYRCPEGYDLALKKIKVGEKKYAFEDGKEQSYPIYEYEITDADNVTKRFDCYGTMKYIVDEKGNRTTLSYDKNYNLKSVSCASGKTYLFTCAEDGKVTGITLPNGGKLVYTYDGNDNLIRFTDAEGAVTRYEYDAEHRMTAWYDGNGNRIVQNTYDGEGRVTKQTDANGYDALFEYGKNQTATVDGNGNKTVYQYDGNFRTKKILYEDGTSESMEYGDNRLISQTDALGHKTEYRYDSDGNVILETRFDGARKTYTYDGAHHILSETDYDGAETSYTYDGEGNVLKVVKEGVLLSSFAYDGQGRTLSQTDANGNTTSYSYTGAELTRITSPDGSSVGMTYNAMGQIEKVTDGEGNTTSYTYDRNGNKTGETDGSGSTVQYRIDAAGQVASETDGNGHTVRYTYDGLGNMTRAEDEEGNAAAFAYDGNGNCVRETDARGHSVQTEYDSQNRPVKETDGEGREMTRKYDALGNLTEETDARGKTSTYTYDYASGEKESETDPEGSCIRYRYDKAGNLVETEYADGSKETSTYDKLGREVSHTEANGLEVRYEYDAAGNLVLEDEGGIVTEYEYDSVNRLVKTIYANGGTEENEYDKAGNLVSETDSEGNRTAFAYDGANRLIRMTDALGYTTEYAYDGNGNLSEETDGNGNTARTSYNLYNQPETETDALGHETKYGYTPGEEVKEVTDPEGNRTAYEYDLAGNLICVTDPLGHKTQMTYDTNGNCVSLTEPDGSKTTYAYDSNDRIIREEDAEGLVTEYSYDKNGMLTRRKDNAGTDERYAYDASGQLLGETDSLGQRTAYTYDIQGNLASVTEPDGNRTEYSYDEMGNVVRMTDPEGKVTDYRYDLNNQVISETDSGGRTYRYAYDAAGNLVKETDPLGNETSYEYDGAGNLIKTVDAAGNAHKFTYDAMSRLIGEEDRNGHLTTYRYDALGNLKESISPDNGKETYTYDAVGNLLTATDAEGGKTAYTYDSLGRVIRQKMPEGGVYAYTYNRHGEVTSETEPEGQKTSYAYDLADRLIKEEGPEGAVFTYRYDALGRVIEEKSPNNLKNEYVYDRSGNLIRETDQSGRSYTYRYDKMHRLTESTDPLGQKTKYAYDKNGNLSEVSTPMGYKTSYAYDALDRIKTQSEADGSRMSLDYDAMGNVTGITENGKRKTSYTYDALGNQTSETDALGQKTSYTYDSMSRLVKETNAGGKSTLYGYDKNSEVTSITDKNRNVSKLSYDKNGNLTAIKDGTGRDITYRYDGSDRLVSARLGEGKEAAEAHYSYDRTGNLLTQKDGNGNVTSYKYDKLGNLTEEKDALGRATSYKYDRNGRLSKVSKPGGDSVTYHYNVLDDVIKTSYSEKEDGRVLYGYDKDGRRVTMKDLTGESTYTYDSAGRITGVKSGDGSTVLYSYDEYGNLKKLTYPDGSKVTYSYDALDRLVKVKDRDGKITEYSYDADGNMTQVRRGNKTRSELTYDGEGQILSVKNYGKNGRVISKYAYTYDSGGNILTEEITQGRKKTRWQYFYNSRGEVEEAAATGAHKENVRYSYDKAGNKVRITQSEENAKKKLRTVIENRYNALNQLEKSKDSKAGTTEYEYDKDGNLIRELTPDEKVLEYEYDTENRLRAIKENGSLLQAALYDGDDNRVFTASRRTVTEKAKTSGNQTAGQTEKGGETDKNEEEDGSGGENISKTSADVNSHGTEEYHPFWYGFVQSLSQGYALTDFALSDAVHRYWDTIVSWFHGNIMGDEPNAEGIVRNPEEELPEPEGIEPDSGYADSLYAQTLIPQGVSEKDRDTYELTRYINDINQEYVQTLMEYNTENGDIRGIYDYGNERLNYYDEEDDTYSYLYDGKGSVSELAGEKGTGVVSYTYSLYGETSAYGESANPYTYNAEYTDDVTGNQYLRARYYRPATGNFLTMDSETGDTEEPASLNRYTYAGNDPVNMGDPSGHWLLKKFVGAVKSTGKKIVKTAKKTVSSAKTFVKKKVSSAKTFVKKQVSKAKTFVKKQVTKAKKAVQKVVKKVKKTVQKAVKKVKKTVKKIRKAAKKVVKKAAKTIKKKATSLYKKAKKTASAVKKHVCTSVKRVQKTVTKAVKNIDWKKVAIGTAALAASTLMVVATGGAGAAVVAALHLSSGGLAAAIATGATAGAIGGATYGFTESLLSGNDAATVAKDTVIGGVSGGVTGGILAGAAYGIQKGASAIGNAIKGNNTPLRQDPLGSNGGACFVAGTLVLTSLGLKAIENIQPGDKVLAADPETGRQEEKEVVRTFVKETNTLVHLRIGGEEIVTTENHPFYVDVEGWVTAGELTEEDYVLDSEGRRLQVEEKYVEKLEESVKVYNFEVEEYHTYYVGDAGILVHNKCWDDPPVKKTSKKQVSIDDSKFEKWLNKGKANNTVYFGLENEEKTYAGITRQKLSRRRYQHNHFGGKNFDRLDPQYENLTRNQARALEQYHIKNGPNKRNKINSIGIKNKYHDAAEEWAANYIKNLKN